MELAAVCCMSHESPYQQARGAARGVHCAVPPLLSTTLARTSSRCRPQQPREPRCSPRWRTTTLPRPHLPPPPLTPLPLLPPPPPLPELPRWNPTLPPGPQGTSQQGESLAAVHREAMEGHGGHDGGWGDAPEAGIASQARGTGVRVVGGVGWGGAGMRHSRRR